MVFSFPSACRRFSLLLTLLSLAGGLGHAQTENPYVEGEVIVTFKTATSLRTADSALQRKSLRFTRRFEGLSARRQKPTGLVRNGGRNTRQLIQDLQSDPDVESVEPNYLRWIKASPNDTRFAEMWALKNTGQTVDGTKGTSGADIKYVEAWAKAKPVTGEVVVGVIDTGVEVTHPELAPRMWTNSAEIPDNNIDDDGNGYRDDYYGFDFADNDKDPTDVSDHGTHLAGTIAAQGNNGAGVIGVNDRARIMALKVSTNGDTMSTSAVIEAMEYAVMMKRRGVNIVALNASYGGPSYSNAERAAIVSAGDNGIIVCAAAGNDSVDNNNSPSYPASYGLPNIITVAASDSKDGLSDFSNYGSTSVDLAAPGSSILSTAPSGLSLQVGSNTYETATLTFSGATNGLSGTIYDCGLGYPGNFPSGVSGNIALIARGTLTFAEKAANAKAAGAKAAIIYNNEPGNFLGTLGDPGSWIPARAISQADGLAIKALVPVQGTLVKVVGYQFMDGTSMATPHVTGAVAFAAMNFPNESLAQRKQRILASVDVKPGLQGKVRTNGRLNLDRVVDANQDGVPDWQATALSITNAAAMKGGLLGLPYTKTFTTANGTGPFTFSVAQGSLPPGLALATDGLLSGIPEQVGTFSFTLQVLDASQDGGSKTFTLVIAADAPRIVTETDLPAGTTGVSYLATLAAAGGTAPYTWTVSSGALPAGLALSSTGRLSGYPATAGPGTFTLKITDANQLVAEKELSLTVTPSPITIIPGAELPYAMKAELYSQSLTAEGGTGPYTWTLSTGALPPGVSLGSTGVLQGKPTVAGTSQFRFQVQDAENRVTSKVFSLTVRTLYTAPVLHELALGSSFVGAAYTAKLTATNYPKSFKLKGLPSGLTYSSSTGLISGRPKVSGAFTVYATATNKGGTSPELSGILTIRSLDTEWIGTFAGWIARDPDTPGLGSRFTLTTTSLGSYTVKVTTGTSAKSAKGFLSEADPQVDVLIHGQTLKLYLNGDTQLITGTHGSATVHGWRSPWNTKTLPANTREGYYSASLKLSTPGDDGVDSIPQGAGYVTARVSTAGVVTVTGRTALGETITSSSTMGPDGQALVYQSLYKNKGSLLGGFTVNLDTAPNPLIVDNRLAGDLTWLKPADTARAYSGGFGPLTIALAGGYLAPKSSGSIVHGIPLPGTPALAFTDGGLVFSDKDPNVAAFDYSSSFVLKMPVAGAAENPGRTTLTINKATGLVGGSFTLEEEDVVLKRKATFYGIVIPQPAGDVKAEGYFLLPQIPINDQKSSATPVLSGGIQIIQPSAAE